MMIMMIMVQMQLVLLAMVLFVLMARSRALSMEFSILPISSVACQWGSWQGALRNLWICGPCLILYPSQIRERYKLWTQPRHVQTISNHFSICIRSIYIYIYIIVYHIYIIVYHIYIYHNICMYIIVYNCISHIYIYIYVYNIFPMIIPSIFPVWSTDLPEACCDVTPVGPALLSCHPCGQTVSSGRSSSVHATWGTC